LFVYCNSNFQNRFNDIIDRTMTEENSQIIKIDKIKQQ